MANITVFTEHVIMTHTIRHTTLIIITGIIILPLPWKIMLPQVPESFY